MKETSEVLGHVLNHVANHTNTTGLSAGEIVGISIGAVGVAVFAAAVGIFCCRRMLRQAKYNSFSQNKRGSESVDAEENSHLTFSPDPTR